jgi:hypothetical protein
VGWAAAISLAQSPQKVLKSVIDCENGQAQASRMSNNENQFSFFPRSRQREFLSFFPCPPGFEH